jgi:hypothetical protein
MVAMSLASQSLQRVLGVFEPAVRQGAQHKSDRTLRAERGESDMANFHLYDNLTKSIKHTGRIILDYIPRVFDVQRVTRIIGEDGRPDVVTLNEKKTDESGEAILKVLNDVTVGTYDVVMDSGPGYETKRQEGTDAALELMQTPIGQKVAAVADDVIVRNMDFNGADAIADRLAAANPLAQIDEKLDVPPQVQMMVKGLQEQLQQSQEVIQALQTELKLKTGIEQMRQDGATQRELMKQTTAAHRTESENLSMQHSVESKAVTAQNIAEINALATLLSKHMDVRKFMAEVQQMNAEQQVKHDEPASAPSALQ